jgi:hypothetical protein
VSTGIKPIETRYAGCRFRSRLEARWAVFFDHVGVRWEYEPQGFVVAGRAYLPDFLLPDCGTWVEVKGSGEHLDKPLMLAAAEHLPEIQPLQEAGPRLLILGPMPKPPTTGTTDFDWGWLGLDFGPDFDTDQPTVLDRWWGFGSYSKNHRPWVLMNAPTNPPLSEDDDDWLTPTIDDFESGAVDSYRAARSARFEHGERG